MGASDDVLNAMQTIKSHAALSLIFDHKILKTVLLSNPRAAQRIVASTDAGQQFDVLTAAGRKAGLQAVMNGTVQRPRGLPRGSSSLEPEVLSKKDPVGASSPPSQSPTPDPGPTSGTGDSSQNRKSRWSRSAVHASTDMATSGWRTVRRALRSEVVWDLVSEWSVPVLPTLKLNLPGIHLCENEADAIALVTHLTALPPLPPSSLGRSWTYLLRLACRGLLSTCNEPVPKWDRMEPTKLRSKRFQLYDIYTSYSVCTR